MKKVLLVVDESCKSTVYHSANGFYLKMKQNVKYYSFNQAQNLSRSWNDTYKLHPPIKRHINIPICQLLQKLTYKEAIIFFFFSWLNLILFMKDN